MKQSFRVTANALQSSCNESISHLSVHPVQPVLHWLNQTAEKFPAFHTATASLNLCTSKTWHSIRFIPSPKLRGSFSYNRLQTWRDVWYLLRYWAWGVPRTCWRQSLKPFSWEPLSIFACWGIRRRGQSVSGVDWHVCRDTHRSVLRIDGRCVNAHAGLSWGSGCWKLSLEGNNTADCWVTDTYTQPFN